MGGVNGPEESAESVSWADRVENIRDLGAGELARWVVDLEDELAASKRDADFGWQHAEKQAEFVGEWAGLFVAQGKEAQRLLRYRLAWLSARRRAARESEYAAEALELKDAEVANERARSASFVAEVQPLIRQRMEDLRRTHAFVADVQKIRGRTICDGNEIDHLRDVYASLHELEDADREGRPYRAHIDRLYPADGA